MEIFFGVLSGVLTSALLWGLKTLWDDKFFPMLQKARYGGVIVAGSWAGHTEDDDTKTEINLVLRQNSHDLVGSLMVSNRSKPGVEVTNNFNLQFDVDGYIWEGYLTLNLTPMDREITSYGTILLKLHGGGSIVIGQMLFRDVFKEEVAATYMTLHRNTSAAA